MGRKSRKKREQRLASSAPSSGAQNRKASGKRPASRQRAYVAFLEAYWPHVIGAAVALAVIPQGLFFPGETYLAALVVALVGLVWLSRQGWRLDLDWADLAIVGLVIVAVLSYAWAANRANAVAEAAEWGSAAVLYLIARRHEQGAPFLDGLLIGGAALLAVGLGESLGVVNIAQWFLAGRLTLGLQYPDSAAAFAFALGFLALWRSLSTTDRWRIVLVALAAAFWTDAVLTVSRGAFLAVLPAGVIGLLLTRRGDLGRALGLVGIALLGAVIGTALSLKANGAIGLVAALGMGGGLELLRARVTIGRRSALVVTGAVLVLLVAVVVQRAARPIVLSAGSPFDVAVATSTPKATLTMRGPGTASVAFIAENAYGTPTTVRSQDVRLGTGGTTLTVPFAGAPRGTTTDLVEVTAQSGTTAVSSVTPSSPLLVLARVLPYSVYDRFATLGPSDLSVWQRILFIGDSFRLWSRNPLLGWGGGGWASAYRSTETFGYTSLETHSSFTDILTSYGAVGGVLFLAFWVFALFGAARGLRERPGAGLAVAAVLALLLHSLIDFDFNFPALVMTTMLMVGALRERRLAPVWIPARWTPAVAALILAAMAGTAFAGAQDVASGQAAQAQGEKTAAQAAFAGATTWAPYDAQAWLGYAETQSTASGLLGAVQTAVSNAPDDASVLVVAANLAGQAKDFTLARRLGREAIIWAPTWASPYATQGQILLNEAIAGPLAKGDYKSVQATLAGARRVMATYDRTFASESQYPSSVNIGPSPRFLLTEGEVDCLLGDVPQAVHDLSAPAVAGGPFAQIAAAWLYALGGVYQGQVPRLASLKGTWSGGSHAITQSQVSTIEAVIAAMRPYDTASTQAGS